MQRETPVMRREATVESQTQFNLALGKISRSNYRGALGHLVEALRIAPGHPAYLSHFGLCLAHAHEDYERAAQACTQAVNASPKDPMPLVQLARVCRMKGDNLAAHAALLRAHKLNKRNPATAAELARMGIRRPPFIPFLSRSNIFNRYLGMLRAILERRLLGRRAC